MVAIRVCKWCGVEFDAYVGIDGVYCSTKCEHAATAEKTRLSIQPISIPEGKENEDYFDDLPAMSYEEIETAIARMNGKRNKARWE